MSAKNLTRAIVAVLIATLLAGAYLIVERNNAGAKGTKQEAPSGFFH
jgi:hypothetical protein